MASPTVEETAPAQQLIGGQQPFQVSVPVNEGNTLRRFTATSLNTLPGQSRIAPSTFQIFDRAPVAIERASNKLQNVSAVKIQEKRNMAEAITGVEQNNFYTVADLQGRELFAVKENSSCCERTCFCCCPDWKSWRMDFYNLPQHGSGGEKDLGEHFMHIQRKCFPVCCCLCKPAVHATGPEGKGVGTVIEPRTRCCYNYSLEDSAGGGILTTSGEANCQSGRWCRCPGFEVSFPIYDVERNNVAEVRKTWTKGDCCPCCFTDWNRYMVEFGKDAGKKDIHKEYKLMLVVMALVVQMRHFDTR